MSDTVVISPYLTLQTTGEVSGLACGTRPSGLVVARQDGSQNVHLLYPKVHAKVVAGVEGVYPKEAGRLWIPILTRPECFRLERELAGPGFHQGGWCAWTRRTEQRLRARSPARRDPAQGHQRLPRHMVGPGRGRGPHGGFTERLNHGPGTFATLLQTVTA